MKLLQLSGTAEFTYSCFLPQIYYMKLNTQQIQCDCQLPLCFEFPVLYNLFWIQ